MVVERARQTTDGSGMALTRRNQARSLEFAAGYEKREREREREREKGRNED